METENPNFTLATVNPPMIFGPVEQWTTVMSLNQSAKDIWHLMSGKARSVPSTALPAFIDVRDCAEAHVRAYEHTSGGCRFLPVSGPFQYKDVCRILREELPEYASRVPVPEGVKDIEVFRVDNSFTRRELSMTFTRPLRETIRDMAISLDQIAQRHVLSEKL